MRRVVLMMLAVVSSSVAWAGEFEDGDAAYKRNDYAIAAKKFRSVAANGNVIAQVKLGWLYAQGQGVAQDYAEAVKWFRLAALQGNAIAQYNLGGMYAQGQGVAQDYVRAHMWLSLAAVSGVTASIKWRDTTANLMSPQQLAEAQKMAQSCQAKKLKGCG